MPYSGFPTQQNREFSNAYQGIFFGEQGNLIKRERDGVIAVRRHLVGDGPMHSTYQYVGSSPIPTELMRRNELPLCVGNVLDRA